MVIKHPLVGGVGGVLLLFAGLVLGYIPLQFVLEPAIMSGPFSIIELVVAVLIILSGVGVLLRAAGVGTQIHPNLSTLLGIAGVLLSLFSFALPLGGGFGGLLGVVGGLLSVLWQPSGGESIHPGESDDHIGTD